MDNPKVNLTVEVNTTELENTTTNFNGLNEALKNIANKINLGAEKGAEQLANEIKSLQQTYLTLGDHVWTGELYNSIETEGGSLSYSIGSNLDGYSPNVIENGRGDVYPIHASFLHYVTRDGDEVFSRHSGPFKADPYVEPSAETARNMGANFILDVINGELG